MVKEKIDSIVCEQCDHEIAAIYKEGDAPRELKFHQKTAFNIVDKEKNIGTVTCPKCNHNTIIDLSVMEGF